MYREESISSAFSSVNGKSRGALDRKVRVNGATLSEKLRTKDGRITKAKAQMRKNASVLSPEVLYFFRDEMEKEALLTPASALKAMNYTGRGAFGKFFEPTVRKAGQLGHRAQMFAASPGVQQAMQSATQGAMYGNVIPSLVVSTVGGAAKALGGNAGTSTILNNAGEFAANFV